MPWVIPVTMTALGKIAPAQAIALGRGVLEIEARAVVKLSERLDDSFVRHSKSCSVAAAASWLAGSQVRSHRAQDRIHPGEYRHSRVLRPSAEASHGDSAWSRATTS